VSEYLEQLKKKIDIQEILCDFEQINGRMPTEAELRQVYSNEEQIQMICSVANRSMASKILASIAYFLGAYAFSILFAIFSEIPAFSIWLVFLSIWVTAKIASPILRQFRRTRKLSFLLNEI
jgi:hypothetical protein